MMDLTDLGKALDGFAGLAALINGLLLWPIVKTLKQDHQNHSDRIAALEKAK